MRETEETISGLQTTPKLEPRSYTNWTMKRHTLGHANLSWLDLLHGLFGWRFATEPLFPSSFVVILWKQLYVRRCTSSVSRKWITAGHQTRRLVPSHNMAACSPVFWVCRAGQRGHVFASIENSDICKEEKKWRRFFKASIPCRSRRLDATLHSVFR